MLWGGEYRTLTVVNPSHRNAHRTSNSSCQWAHAIPGSFSLSPPHRALNRRPSQSASTRYLRWPLFLLSLPSAPEVLRANPINPAARARKLCSLLSVAAGQNAGRSAVSHSMCIGSRLAFGGTVPLAKRDEAGFGRLLSWSKEPVGKRKGDDSSSSSSSTSQKSRMSRSDDLTTTLGCLGSVP